MEHRNAFITGASSGIGEALARRLAAQGLEVALAARRTDRLEQLADTIRRDGGRARVYPVDVSDTARATATLERADAEMDGVDLVVANAGMDRPCWAGELTWETCAAEIGVNVVGATATLVALLPRMVERRRGHLVGISSLAQYRGLPKNAVYCATKAFLSRFLEGLRIDLQGKGVTVTDVRPGFVRTPLTADNDFDMPFLLEVETAARLIVDGIRRDRPVVAFPWQLATAVRTAQVVPAAIYDRVIGKMGP